MSLLPQSLEEKVHPLTSALLSPCVRSFICNMPGTGILEPARWILSSWHLPITSAQDVCPFSPNSTSQLFCIPLQFIQQTFECLFLAVRYMCFLRICATASLCPPSLILDLISKADHYNAYLHFLFLGFGSHFVALRGYSMLCTQKLLLADSGPPGIPGMEPG